MRIHLQRSDRETFFGRRVYALSIIGEFTDAEQQVIANHQLINTLVYTSPEYDRHARRSQAALELGDDIQPEGFWLTRDLSEDWRVVKTKWSLYSQSSQHAKRAQRSFHLTIGDLLRGDTFETRSVLELGAVEDALIEAAQLLEAFLIAHLAYERHDTDVIEPDAEVADGVPPDQWRPPATART